MVDQWYIIFLLGIKSTVLISPSISETQDLPTIMIDDDATSEYSSRAHSRQSSSVSCCCLDELLGELEEKRDSSVLFVEEEPSDVGDDDSGIFLKPTQKFQLRWKLKPKALFRNGSSVVTSVSNRWHRSVEVLSNIYTQ